MPADVAAYEAELRPAAGGVRRRQRRAIDDRSLTRKRDLRLGDVRASERRTPRRSGLDDDALRAVGTRHRRRDGRGRERRDDPRDHRHPRVSAPTRHPARQARPVHASPLRWSPRRRQLRDGTAARSLEDW
jgi:hypothetical protein